MSWTDFGNGPGVYRSSEDAAETTVQLAAVPDILEELRIGVNERIAITDLTYVDPFEYDSQIVTITGATGGTFRLWIFASYTIDLDYDASSSELQGAVDLILGEGNTLVTGDAGGPYAIQFTGELDAREIGLFVVDGFGLEGEDLEIDVSIGPYADGSGLSYSQAKFAVAQLKSKVEGLATIGYCAIEWPPPESEAPGGEIAANGDMEVDSDWDTVGDPDVCEQSDEEQHGGSYSWKILANAAEQGIRQNLGGFKAGLVLTISFYHRALVESILNGDMEIDSDWHSWKASGDDPAQVQDDEFPHTGTYSRKVTVTPATTYGGIEQIFDIALTSRTVSVSFWHRTAAGTNVDLRCTISGRNEGEWYDNLWVSAPIHSSDAYASFLASGIAIAGEYDAFSIQIRTRYASVDGVFYIDNVSMVRARSVLARVTDYPDGGTILGEVAVTAAGAWAESSLTVYTSTDDQEVQLQIMSGESDCDAFFIDDVSVTAVDGVRPFVTDIHALLALTDYKSPTWFTFERLQDGQVYEQVRQVLDLVISAGRLLFSCYTRSLAEPGSAYGPDQGWSNWTDFMAAGQVWHLFPTFLVPWLTIGVPFDLRYQRDSMFDHNGWWGAVIAGTPGLLFPANLASTRINPDGIFVKIDSISLLNVKVWNEITYDIGGISCAIPVGEYPDATLDVGVGDFADTYASGDQIAVDVSITPGSEVNAVTPLVFADGQIRMNGIVLAVDDGSTWTKKP
jgi:hypothetical protein